MAKSSNVTFSFTLYHIFGKLRVKWWRYTKKIAAK